MLWGFDMLYVNILTVIMMITSLAVFGLRNYKFSVYTYALQTLLLVLIFFALSSIHGVKTLAIWGVVAFFTKVIFVPFIMLTLIKKIGLKSEDEPVAGFFISPVVALSFSLAVSMMIYPIFQKFALISGELPLIASFFIFMVGIFGFVLRNSFIKQILAYCLFENGIHLSLALMAYNSHELVEIGILTDAIFAVIIMSILAFRFYGAYGSLDTSKATNLRG